ncbi:MULTISPECIES: hypothetical protein [Leptospira]|uniref:Putative membrane protein n=1 Tax=Leptospira weilii str. Ecochallenge TaxID=1049986 RepID=N1TW82_9LEPT|nr:MULTISPECIES: hypothetical protein [Leptospira]EMJ65246.1 putative membrane protein [Leptospira sp. P2653]EMY12528.1 putative membrane protein [Leptospira weilii str. Ecochallenge]OMI17766.1 hypothetical protein BUQ74_08155 [Leptospira weilii serovar Heyan]
MHIFGSLIWFLFLSFCGSLTLIFASQRVGEQKSSTYGAVYEDFKKSWGGETSIPPIQFFFMKKIVENEYNIETKIEKSIVRIEEIPVIPNSIEYQADINYDEQSKGWLSFNAFEAVHFDTYYLINEDGAAGDLYMRLVKPNENALLKDIHVAVDGISKDNVFKILGEPFLLQKNFHLGSRIKLETRYTEKGMETLKYSISAYEHHILSSLKATFHVNTPEFEVYQLGLSHSIESDPKGGKWIRFDLKNFATSQDLGISFQSKSAYLDRIENLVSTSPLSLILFISVIFVFTQIQKIKFHPIHYLFYSIICIFYFLFVTYLIRFVGVFPSFGLAGLLTGVMFILYSPNVLGWEFSLKILAPYLATLTLALSVVFLLPVFKGITFVTLVFLVCISIMLSISKSKIEDWPISKPEI